MATQGTQKLLEEHYLLPVTSIRVTIHTLGIFFESDTRSENHTSIYLLTGDKQSVQLNMIKAGPTDVMGTLLRKRCGYDLSNTALKRIDLQAIQGLTVGQVLQLLDQKGRANYKLAPSGMGCRFWV
ncbi:hypothetical protein CIHG_07192 [Coccidioides immitis H538.4]|nr:hypothetical protein CIRG_09095 [Coccidioides immitis RMSCC 2394]KMU81247.1 hypothetical protein CISG_02625 [Coccidioides immitis RMSCC 3703]KMU89386.1 hypothetical protein CIHG_07192 [Coccidioides immitis H538.4]